MNYKDFKKNNLKFKYPNDILYQILSYNDNNSIENFFIKIDYFYSNEKKENLINIFESLLKRNLTFFPSKSFIKYILNKNLNEFYDLCKFYKRIPPKLSTLYDFTHIFNNIFYIFNFQFDFNYNNDIQNNLYTFNLYLNEFNILENSFNNSLYFSDDYQDDIFKTEDILYFLKNFDFLFIFDNDIYIEEIDLNIINNIYLNNNLLNILNKLYIEKKNKNTFRDYINEYYNQSFENQYFIKNNKIRYFDLSVEFIHKQNDNIYWLHFISNFSKKYQIHLFQNLHFYLYLTIKYFIKNNKNFNHLYLSFVYSYVEHESILNFKLPKINFIKNHYWGDINIIKNNIKKYNELFKFLRLQYLESYVHFSKKQHYYFLLKNFAYFILDE